MPALFNRTFGTDVQKDHITQLFDAWEGVAGGGVPFNNSAVSDNASYAAKIRNLGTAGALLVQDSGGNTLIRANDSGTLVALGTITTQINVLSSTVTWNAAVTFTGWKLNVTDTSSNSGSLLADLQVGGTTMFNVSKAGVVAVAAGTATPAGGSTGVRLVFGTTAGFGIYIGSGVPTVSAAQGSLYLRSDGSSSSTRAYMNSTGSTAWVAVTTAS